MRQFIAEAPLLLFMVGCLWSFHRLTTKRISFEAEDEECQPTDTNTGKRR